MITIIVTAKYLPLLSSYQISLSHFMDEKTCSVMVLRIYSKDVVKDLEKLNVFPNKTYRSEFPICNNEYFFDFLRGFNDGDGCIHVDSSNRISVNFTNSNKDFLMYIQDEVQKRIDVIGHIYKEKDKKYRLVYCKQIDVKKLLDNLYIRYNLCLQRKYSIYQSYYGFTA